MNASAIQEKTSQRTAAWPFVLIGFAAISVGTAAVSLKLIEEGERIGKWQSIRDEIGVELPAVCRGILAVSETTFLWPVLLLAVIGLAVIWFALRQPTKRRVLVGFSMLAVVLAGLFLFMNRASRLLDLWLAGEMVAAPELDADSVARHVQQFSDESMSWDQRLREARTVIAIGMKQSAGLLTVSQADRSHLRVLAMDHELGIHTRYLAAWSLMSVDRGIEKSCQAISEGMGAALSSEDDDLVAMAEHHLGHPCVNRPLEKHGF